MDTRLAWKMLVSSIIMIGSTESCAPVYDGTINEVTETNTNSQWLVLVSNQLGAERCWIHGVSYGSLIKEDVVLTAASKISRFSPSDLEVITNFKLTEERSCDSRSVSDLIFPPNFDKNQVKPSDWVLLVLNEPFELYDRVSIIPLADKNHQWDSEDCLIYRWVAVKAFDKENTKRQIIEHGILHRDYRVSLTPGTSGFYEEEKAKLHDSLDCIIGECFKNGDQESILANISFVGSPIVCKLVDQDQYIQVGLTTFLSQWIVQGTEDNPEFVDITEYDEDNFVELVKDFDELIVPEVLTD